MLEELGIPLRRANEDKVINQYVRKLLDFCKYNDVFILNGRICEDKDIGKFTCKNVGVVDSFSGLRLFTEFSKSFISSKSRFSKNDIFRIFLPVFLSTLSSPIMFGDDLIHEYCLT
jgi:hypothetical protein